MFIKSIALLLLLSVNAYAATSVDDGSRFRSLAASVCAFYSSSGSEFPKDFNQIVEDNMRIYDGVTHPTAKQKVNFLNKHKHKMTCGSRKNKKHYMMVAFDEGGHTALFKRVFMQQYISQDRSARIDVNAVSYTGSNGAPETVLDYMNKILADKSRDASFRKKVARLKRYFILKLAAKRFVDLPASEQAKFKH